jgi:hypothetical protein
LATQVPGPTGSLGWIAGRIAEIAERQQAGRFHRCEPFWTARLFAGLRPDGGNS